MKVAIDYLGETLLREDQSADEPIRRLLIPIQNRFLDATGSMKSIQRTWTWVAIPAVILAGAVLLISVVLAITGNIEIGLVQGGVGILTAGFSALIFQQLRSSKNAAVESLKSLSRAHKNLHDLVRETSKQECEKN